MAYAEHGGGWVEIAPLLVQSLLAAATGRGATLREQTSVNSIEREGEPGHCGRTGAGEQVAADWSSTPPEAGRRRPAMAGSLPLNLRPG